MGGQTLVLWHPTAQSTQISTAPQDFSLESSKVLGGFSSPITTLISLHSSKTNRKKNMTVGSELSTNAASRLKVWVRPSVKCQRGSFQKMLAGRTKWKPRFMWRKGRGRLVCTLQFCGLLDVPLKCHPRKHCNTPTRNRSCSLYFSRGDYLCTCHEFSLQLAVYQNLPLLPQNQMEQGRVTAKSFRLLRSSFPRVMNSPYAVQNYTCDYKGWGFVCEKLYENKHCNPALRPQSILSDSKLDLQDKNNQLLWFWEMIAHGIQHQLLFTANANALSTTAAAASCSGFESH